MDVTGNDRGGGGLKTNHRWRAEKEVKTLLRGSRKGVRSCSLYLREAQRTGGVGKGLE